ncbi:MAG: Gldg family protein [Oscillospiraceae bacterium]|nr:Gldg family protein [Candidatus Equicaccousia limihippi]
MSKFDEKLEALANSSAANDAAKAEYKDEKKAEKAARKEKTSAQEKIKNTLLLKRGSFSLAVIIIFLAVLVLVNVLSTVIAKRYSTTIDVTADKSFKLSDENITFLKQLSQQEDVEKIEIILCASKEDYTGSAMVNYVGQTYNLYEDSTPYNFFNQTVRLIEEYPKYDTQISVDYQDPQDPSFSLLDSETDINISYGDIITRCYKKSGPPKTDVLTFEEIYETESSYDSAGNSQGYYRIGYNNLENALSGSLNKIALSVSTKAGIVTVGCDASTLENLKKGLANYDYSFTELAGIINEESLKGLDTVIIAQPTADFDSATLKAFDSFLDNGGKLGKSVIYFASPSSPATPNLNQFLAEWGITVHDGVLYETDMAYCISDNPTSFMQFYEENANTLSLKNSQKGYFSMGNVPFTTAYQTNGNKTTNILLKSTDSTVIAPKGTASKITVPSTQERKAYPTVILTENSQFDENTQEIRSCVLAFAGVNFIDTEWTMHSRIGNMDLALVACNAASGRSNALAFSPKITGVTGMDNPASAEIKSIVTWIFVIILPLACIIGGVALWLTRRKK